MCSTEAPIHERIKAAIVDAKETSTQLIFRTLRNTARVADNSVSREVVDILNRGGTFEDIRELVAGARGRTVYELGDPEAGIWFASAAQGLIRDIPSVAELVSRVIEEAVDVITNRLGSLVASTQSELASA
jgi:nitronate monooxygenase